MSGRNAYLTKPLDFDQRVTSTVLPAMTSLLSLQPMSDIISRKFHLLRPRRRYVFRDDYSR